MTPEKFPTMNNTEAHSLLPSQEITAEDAIGTHQIERVLERENSFL